jgi:lysozyme family protein
MDYVRPMLTAAEGGYVDHPSDRGGETNHGITVDVARKQGWIHPMKDMPLSFALGIYERIYVIAPGFGEVAKISVPIACELVDTGVNMGPGVAADFLQQALNVLNQQGKDYPDVKLDGDVGPATLTALRAYLKRRGRQGETVMLRVLNALQGARYVAISQQRSANEDFAFGWFANRVAL